MTDLMKIFVVAVDGSEPSMRALDLALEMAQPLQAQIKIITVLDLSHFDVYGGYYINQTMADQFAAHLQAQVLNPALARAQTRSVPAEGHVLRGPTAAEILKFAAQSSAALLFAGKTGKGALQRMMEGSVSRRLFAGSTIPFVVVT